MTIPAKVTLITLGVTNIAKSTEFYESLGWQRSSASQEGVTFIQLGSNVLGLFSYEALAEDSHTTSQPRNKFPGFSLAINVESREEVDSTIEHARDVGAIITKEPQEVFWGGYSAYFSDPDGFLWEVAHNPFFEMDENGQLKLD